jgi:hypothetical protein
MANATCLFCGNNFVRRAGRDTKYCTVQCQKKATAAAKTRLCAVCSKAFVTRKRKQTTCSRECYVKSLTTSETRNCEVCGKAFVVIPSRLKRGGGRWCSPQCCGIAKRKDEPDMVSDTCIHCGKTYRRISCDRDRQFCSRACAYRHHRKDGTKELRCPVCGKSFLTSDSTPLRHCSERCRRKAKACEKAVRTIRSTCRRCGKTFSYDPIAAHRRQKRLYCSKRCFTGCSKEVQCRQCGVVFEVPPSCANRQFCSNLCKNTYLTGENAAAWNGGVTVSKEGYIHVWCSKPGQRGKYRAQHRLIAEEFIGRKLERNGEPILHVNNQMDDNRPENLYVCASKNECSSIVNGGAPFPDQSNLDDLRRANEETTKHAG